MENNEVVVETNVSKETIDNVLAEWKLGQYQAMSDNLGTNLAKITTALMTKFFADNYDEFEETLVRINKSRTQEKLAGK